MMRQVVLNDDGSLGWSERARPVSTGRDLLVRVEAVAVNPVDVKQPPPKPPDPPRVLGYDVAGIVEETGPEASLFSPGDTVYYAGSITRPGGFSEYHVVDERIVGPKPQSLSFAEAAALPLTTITAWEGLFDRLRLPRSGADGAILIIGAAGGVGSIAVQLARLAGLTVIGTASRPESRRWVMERGAHHVINHFEPLAPQLDALGIGKVPYIFCLNRVSPHWEPMMSVLAPEGSVCTILPPGEVDMGPIWGLSATLAAESMFVRPRFETPSMLEQHRLLTEVSRLVDDGVLKTTLSEETAPISPRTLTELFERIRAGHTTGKLAAVGFDA